MRADGPAATPQLLSNNSDHKHRPDWAQLLVEAVSKPGIISTAYSRFWNYSFGNQLLAMMQCMARGIEPGPIHTFKGWRDLGRHVKKGQKALTLCMPVIVKRRDKPPEAHIDVETTIEPSAAESAGASAVTKRPVAVKVFTYKPHWFVLSQTEGAEYVPTITPEWREDRALSVLAVTRVSFIHPNGNCQGYAQNRSVAVSPIAALPHKTLFHEFAHVVLGHTVAEPALDDHDLTPPSLREAEAESVALICCESLGLPGITECRGYIQSWLGTEVISDRSAQRIFKAADAILKAGYPAAITPQT
jgi:hypothetical protein